MIHLAHFLMFNLLLDAVEAHGRKVGSIHPTPVVFLQMLIVAIGAFAEGRMIAIIFCQFLWSI